MEKTTGDKSDSPNKSKNKINIMIIYIGFSKITHKLYAKILCKKFRHCAPIIINKKNITLYQFVNRKKIVQIQLKLRDIKILERYDWKFIKYKAKNPPLKTIKNKSLTCVQFTKKVCGIQKIFIQTPDQLFKFLHDN